MSNFPKSLGRRKVKEDSAESERREMQGHKDTRYIAEEVRERKQKT